MISQIY